ncbi:MAG TPA: hypothetical protein VE890_02420, partial [Thermoguttaceae bacterium]|nr:hypothetical protein [Thermoguttaceae bacterium]
LYSHNVNRPLEELVSLHGRTIGSETLDRVRQVLQSAFDCRNDKEALGKVLAARFPNSACRYLLTGKSGGRP